MLGAFHIFSRQIAEIRHRRKLLAFLVLLPIVLMVLVGVAMGDRRVPIERLGETADSTDELKTEKSLMTLFSILGMAGDNGTAQGRVRILAGTVGSGDSGSRLVYVVPAAEQTSVVIVDQTAASYYHLSFASDLSSIKRLEGPSPIPPFSDFEALPEVDLQPLYTSESAVRLARTAASFFQLGLQIETSQGTRLLELLFPELVGIQIAWVGVLGAAVMAVEDRRAGARERILMTPVSRVSFVLGNAMASFALIGFQLAILFSTAILLFRINIAGQPSSLIPVIVISSFTVIGIGLIISHFSKTADEAFYLSTLVNLPMGLLGSYVVSYSREAVGLLVSSFFPMTYANRALTMIMVNGETLSAVLPQLLPLSIFTVLLYPLGLFLLSRER